VSWPIGWDRRSNKGSQNETMRAAGVPGMRETRGFGEKPTIGPPARMPVEMTLARCFWRNEAFFALSVK
jgi:hypothetical protein